ncbi:MAG: hypothetical protein Q8L48_27585 [Archangium sp.]|nr:hypothetical protein [Archangium sp.]
MTPPSTSLGTNGLFVAVLALASATAFAVAPTATTNTATGVTATTVQLNGAGNPGSEATTGWFRLSTTNPGTCDDAFGTRVPSTGGTSLGAGAASAPYSVSTSGLLPGNTYFFCAITQNASGTAFGGLLTFTTPALIPSVATAAATSVTSFTAVFNGSADPNGSAATGFFRYSTTSPGSCTNAFGTRAPAAGGTALGGGNGSVAFTETVTGLLAGTTYYYCALSTNGIGTGPGNLLSFTTLVAVPAVTTTAASSVTGTTATLNGSVNPNGASTTAWFRLASSDPGSCSDVFGTRIPASSGSALGSGSFATPYAQAATGLNPGTTYYYCSIAQNSQGTTLGSVLTFTTPDVPSVTSNAATLVTATSATLNASAIPNGATATGWFRYSASNPGTCSDAFGTRIPAVSGGTALGAGAAPVDFSRAIAGLTPGTTYFYCGLASNSVGTGFGSLLTFTTPPTAPLVTSNGVSLITGSTATLNGLANPRGDATTGWFRYATASPGTCNDSFGTRAPAAGGSALGSSNGSIAYVENLVGLSPGTTYYYCAIAQNSVGLGFGGVGSFTTQDVPTVITSAALGIGGTFATLNGSADPNLGTTTGYFRYGTVSPGTCNDSFGTRAPAAGGTNLGSGTSQVGFAQALSGLTPGATYYFCAIATNGVGTGFGAVLSFFTPAAPAMTTLAASLITATSATMNGSGNPNSATTTAWVRYSATNPLVCDDFFGTRVPSSGGVSLGAGAAPVNYSYATGGLLPGNTYYFCTIGSNSVGTSFGTVQSFTTPPTAPVVNTSSATLVTGTTATLNGTGNPRGDAATGWFRYSTVSPGSCNDSFGTRAPAAGGTALGSANTVLAYSTPITGLTPGTTVFFCAIAGNVMGVSFGGLTSFLVPNVPSVTTTAVNSLTGTTVTLNGTGNPNAGTSSGWFRYALTNPGTCDDSFGTRAPASGGTNLGSSTSPVNFAQSVSGLTPGATYFYCAIASNLVGTGFGSVLTFTTPAVPTVTTDAAALVTATTATLNGTANPNLASTTGWYRYSATTPGTCNDTFGTRMPAISGGTALGAGAAPVAFPRAITGLLPGTTYFVCAIAQNSVGTGFGAVGSFTTPPTAPVVTTSSASVITSNSATIAGTANPRGAATTGWLRYDTVNPGTCNDSFGFRVPLVSGTALGSGNTALAFNQPLTGLSLATTYYYCAIASNSVGTSFGGVSQFTTTAAPPAVTTLAATGITTISASMNASATPNGAAATGWFRYSTTNPGTCSDTFGTRAPASGGTALGSGTSPVPFSVTPATLTTGATYYFCAIASNSAGTSYGAVLTFQTTSTQPTINTLAATAIGGTTATLNGSSTPNGANTTGWFRYSTVSPGSCNDSFGTRAPAAAGTDLGAGVVAMPYSQALTGLTPGATYYFCAISQNSLGTVFGLLLTFATPQAPSVTSNAASPVTANSATLNGTATPNGTAATGWFRYSTTSPGSCDDTFGTRMPATGGAVLGSGAVPANYAQALSGLSPGTSYFFCAVASNAVGTSFGALLSFTTPPAAPSVAASAATAIGSTTATFNASGNPNGAATTGYFRYATTSPGTCNDTFGTRTPAAGGSALGSGISAVPYSQAVTGLLPGTTYYFCPLAVNAVATSFGGVLSFTTTAAPVVVTSAATVVASTSATLNGSANPNRDATTGWYRYSTVNPGTCDDTFGTRAPATGGTPLGAGSSAVVFSQPITGLSQGTVYYFCALAQNGVATSFGTVSSFTTTNAPTPTTLAATGVTGTAATLNGSTNPNGSAATGYFRYSAVDPGSCNDTFGTRTPTTGGTALGAGTAPVAHTRALTGLVAGTTYYFCALGNNAAGTGFGAVLTFTTPGAPTVTTNAPTAITTTSAQLEGAASPNGSAATGHFRYSTVNPVTCNDTFGTRAPATGGAALGAGNTPVAYSQAITGLAPGTTYFACAIANNALGTRFGAPVSFSTSSAPVVTSQAATALSSTGATLNGSANPRSDATTGWFRYATTSPGTCNDTFGTRAPVSGGTSLGAGATAAPYLEALTGLTPGTTYFFCALASNSNGTATGGVLSFTTTNVPVVTTSAATALNATGATLNGSGNPSRATATGWFRYDTTNPGTCNDTFGTRSPATGGTALGAGSTAVAFSSAVTGLTSLTTYYFCAIASNAVGTSLGTVQSFTTPAAPAVTTVAASAVLSTTATLNGSTNPNGLTATGWFRYSTVNPTTCNDTFGTRAPAAGGTALGAGTTAVPHTQALTGLTGGATYYFCAIASNAAGTSFGAVTSFTTPGAPVVTSLAPSAVTSSAASLNGQANPAGSSTTGFFRYSTVNPVTCNNTFGTRAPSTGGTALGSGFTVAPFTETLSGLSAATTYYFCAIGQNGIGTSFGAVMSFTTAAGPAVATSAASAVTGTSATLNGSASPRGLAATGWYRYASTNPGTCNDTFGTRLPATGGTALGAGTTPVGFTENVTGLTPGTTYWFCALASNSAGTSNGSLEVFTTPGPPTVVSMAASGVTASAATLNGSVTANTAATTGWFRYSATNPGSCNDTFGTRAPATGGTALGTATTPISYLQALSGLTAGTTYYFCAIASNSFGTRFGNVLTFATPAPPVVTTLAATGVAGTGATLNGTANPNASAATGWFRYGPTNPTTCNDTFGTRTPSTGGVALGSGTTAAPYAQTIAGLTPGATYFFCAIASNGIGTAFGTPRTFTVPAAGPVVTTSPATLVTGTTATLNGSGNPGGAATTAWLRYATTSPGTCNDTFGTRAPTTGGNNLGSGNATLTFSQALTGLMPGATYFFCAIAQNATATSFGTVLSFTTPGAPTVSTLAAASITGTGATFNGSGNPNGGVTTAWFRYATTNPGTCNDTFGTRAPTAGGNNLGGGNTTLSFSQTATGLTPGTDYFFCALASNVVGLAVGTVETFHTPAAPTVMTSSASNVMGGLATLNGGANPNGATATGWFRYSPVDPGACNDSFGTRTPASGGTALGAGQTSQSYSQNIAGLAPGVTYFFCAISSNLVGTAFGQVLSFTVEAPLPTVTTGDSTDLTTREATLNGRANPRGTAAEGWFRYSNVMPASCDDTFGTRVPAMGGVALGMGNVDAPWSVALTGLKPGVTYYVCAIASNTGGAAFGAVVSFKTANTTPTARTGLPSVDMDGNATLTGGGNGQGMPGKAWFQIGRERPIVCTAAFGEKVPPEGFTLGDSESETPLSHVIPGATGTFFYCAVAETAGGTAFGEVQTFTVEETKTTGCGCGVGGESASLLAFGLVLVLRARRRRS